MSMEAKVSKRRRKHKNSKNGCPNCKRRRVKCSEDLPECQNCIKHKVKCEYLNYSKEQLAELRTLKALQQEEDNGESSGAVSGDELSKMIHKNVKGIGKSSYVKAQEEKLFKSKMFENFQTMKSEMNLKSLDNDFTHQQFMYNNPHNFHHLIDNDFNHNTQDKNDSFVPFESSNSPRRHRSTSSIPDNYNNFYNLIDEINTYDGGEIRHQNIDSSVLQNYDNLTSDPNNIIMYPVYSLARCHSQSISGHGHQRDMEKNLYIFEGNTKSNENDAKINFQNPTAGTGGSIDLNNLHSTTGMTKPSYLNNEVTFNQENNSNQDFKVESNSCGEKSNGLPNSVKAITKFKVLKHKTINYSKKLDSYFQEIGPIIAKGTASWIQIRQLYKYWLGFFINKSEISDLLFSCLINFSTNYLISNCLQHNTNRINIIEKRKLKSQLVVVSIRHYGVTIRGLRELLKSDEDLELTSSISYVLSLMSIYDPEATPNSISCFRDGLFSVLSHYHHQDGAPSYTLIPIHLRLMKNISASVYFPGYDPTFLEEYFQMLQNFWTLKLYKSEFVKSKYALLISFARDCIKNYLPKLLQNLDDMHIQQEVIFEMSHRWVRLSPSRLIYCTAKTEVMEKVLYLFYRTFRKSLYNICPQVRFFLLRDFESPLMMDVFQERSDIEIIEDLQEYPELQKMAKYLIRVNSFLSRRTSLLYREIVLKGLKHNKFLINDIRKWHQSISTITKARDEFINESHFSEVPIQRFQNTSISACHYPHRNEVEPPSNIIPNYEFFQPNGLLLNDYDCMSP